MRALIQINKSAGYGAKVIKFPIVIAVDYTILRGIRNQGLMLSHYQWQVIGHGPC